MLFVLLISLYGIPPKNDKHLNEKYLIEFQRRSGCPLVFHQHYSQLLYSLTQEKICGDVSSTSSQQQQQQQRRFSRASFTATSQITLDKETVDSLLYCLTDSENLHLENVREVLRVLACVTSKDANAAFLIKKSENLSDLLIKFLLWSDAEVKRCAATLLANVISFTLMEATWNIQSLFLALSTETPAPGFGTNKARFLDLEAKRQIARALVKVMEKNASIVVKDDNLKEFRDVLEEMSSSTDRSLANSASVALNHLLVAAQA